MSAPPVPGKKRGCLFYGCLGSAVVLVLVVVFGLIAFNYARKSFRAMVETYTDSQPAALERVQLTDTEEQELQQRVAAFQKALDEQTRQEELVLTERELNALINQNQDLAGKVQARIEGGRLQGRISYPLQNLGPLKLEGRYLNGLATFQVGITNGQLSFAIEDVQVNGKPLPAPIMSELTKKDLAQEIMKDPEAAKNISKFESVDVEDGKIILRNRAERREQE